MNRLILPMALIVLSSVAVAAQPADQRAGDEAAIRKAVASYVEAFNRGDAKGVARHWSAEGAYVSPAGQRTQGREAIQEEFEAYFAEYASIPTSLKPFLSKACLIALT